MLVMMEKLLFKSYSQDLGTDPNVAAVNVQNRVSSVVNKLPPLVVREGLKLPVRSLIC